MSVIVNLVKNIRLKKKQYLNEGKKNQEIKDNLLNDFNDFFLINLICNYDDSRFIAIIVHNLEKETSNRKQIEKEHNDFLKNKLYMYNMLNISNYIYNCKKLVHGKKYSKIKIAEQIFKNYSNETKKYEIIFNLLINNHTYVLDVLTEHVNAVFNDMSMPDYFNLLLNKYEPMNEFEIEIFQNIKKIFDRLNDNDIKSLTDARKEIQLMEENEHFSSNYPFIIKKIINILKGDSPTILFMYLYYIEKMRDGTIEPNNCKIELAKLLELIHPPSNKKND